MGCTWLRCQLRSIRRLLQLALELGVPVVMVIVTWETVVGVAGSGRRSYRSPHKQELDLERVTRLLRSTCAGETSFGLLNGSSLLSPAIWSSWGSPALFSRTLGILPLLLGTEPERTEWRRWSSKDVDICESWQNWRYLCIYIEIELSLTHIVGDLKEIERRNGGA